MRARGAFPGYQGHCPDLFRPAIRPGPFGPGPFGPAIQRLILSARAKRLAAAGHREPPGAGHAEGRHARAARREADDTGTGGRDILVRQDLFRLAEVPDTAVPADGGRARPSNRL
jgi:hypothetical protein